ncbi:MAG: mannose-1-phosphate guanylyltransferase/mannose-6-phosphate isomerase [Desulfovibrionaceae bacterium]|nr:mannose-1-phosphate guanylyltransferase/mannose-6-phosphate isomerase [Desulfovibrionaceae bacterium]
MPEDKKRPAPGFEGCHAVILAGGSGTRLWPLSRSLLPKQLLALNGSRTLLQQTVDRILGCFDLAKVWVVTNEEHVFEVRRQVRDLDTRLEAQVLSEPLSRNTLPAVLLALDHVLEADREARVVVFPSDHLIQDHGAWADCLRIGLDLAGQGRFVTFGVRPRQAETGYGYIERGEPLGDKAFTVAAFVEKPDLDRAKAFVRDGAHYWNSGMFAFRGREFLKAVARFTPEIWDWWLARAQKGLAQCYRELPSVSIDYGVVEKIDNIAVVEAGFDWDDLGSWEAMHRLGTKDRRGNVVQGDVLAMGCSGSLLISRGGKLAAVGLEDMIVVQTRDATLVCPLAEVQQVKDLVATLRSQGSPLVESHPTVERPWGSYCVLEEGPHYKIKRIRVNAGARLSSQMHHHRTEHWVVVHGTAAVEVAGVERTLVENQSIDIPKTSVHRLGNPGKVPLDIIEIQTGPYLGEDDIVRFDDVYGRVK